MTNTPPEIDKHDTYKKWCLTKMAHFVLCKKMPKGYICQRQLRWVIFKSKFLNLSYDSDSWSWDFKVKFFTLQSAIPIILLCLIVGVGFIGSVLVVLQKTNNVAVRCHYLCWVPFCKVVFLIRGVPFL